MGDNDSNTYYNVIHRTTSIFASRWIIFKEEDLSGEEIAENEKNWKMDVWLKKLKPSKNQREKESIGVVLLPNWFKSVKWKQDEWDMLPIQNGREKMGEM
jgi:hypothetical protein